MINTILIVVTVLFSTLLVGTLLGRYIYKRAKGLPTGDCAYCHKGVNKMLKEYHKLYSNK